MQRRNRAVNSKEGSPAATGPLFGPARVVGGLFRAPKLPPPTAHAALHIASCGLRLPGDPLPFCSHRASRDEMAMLTWGWAAQRGASFTDGDTEQQPASGGGAHPDRGRKKRRDRSGSVGPLCPVQDPGRAGHPRLCLCFPRPLEGEAACPLLTLAGSFSQAQPSPTFTSHSKMGGGTEGTDTRLPLPPRPPP